MRVWTVQKREVAEQLMTTGHYQPDFEKSAYLEFMPELADLYYDVLAAFNRINNLGVPGFVFGFAHTDGNSLSPIPNYDVFVRDVLGSKGSIKSMWRRFVEEERVVFELEFDVTNIHGLMPINMNDYLAIMPPRNELLYSRMQMGELHDNLLNGIFTRSFFPSPLAQILIPCLDISQCPKLYAIPDIL